MLGAVSKRWIESPDPEYARKKGLEKFTSAMQDSYQAIAERSVSAQELNAQVTQKFFDGVTNNLRTQAENTPALLEDLVEQQCKQQEASQTLSQESVKAYMDFLNFMFAYYRRRLDLSRGQSGK